MNIVCATDDNFVQHCCVMLISLLTNNSNVTIYILSEGLSLKNQNILKDEIELLGGFYNYIIVDSNIINQLPMPNLDELKHISAATYYRLQVDKLLPSYVNKVIYLDCDIIIRKSIVDLWKINIEGNAIAAVSQFPTDNECLRLKYDPSYSYFNAGVLLINLDYWRKNNISEKLINCLIVNYDSIKYHDQDALNFVLHSRIILSPKWNMLYPYFIFGRENIKDLKFNWNELNIAEFIAKLTKEKKDPTIIHYSSKPKPWEEYCYHPWRNEYYKYALKSTNYKNIFKPNTIKSHFASVKQVVHNALYVLKCKLIRI